MDRFRFGLGVLVALAAACSDGITNVTVCSRVRVSVTSGTTPTFRWSPNCPIEALIVALPGPGAVVWTTFSSNLTNTIASPVTYGVFPPGSAMTTNLQQFLIAGTTYEVSLIRVDSAGGPPHAIGTAAFVP